ncbi:MAG: TIGR01212 family radical SAM protein [Filifactoraceae bacterium]
MEFYSLNKFLKERFDDKVIKLSLDGGFSCPNRDGTLGYEGCIFCSEEGSGEFSGSRMESITEQMKSQVKLLSNKWDSKKYIAYFQSFTNTYGSIDRLRSVYDEALSFPGTVGLAIATRGDCISQDVVDLLSEYNKKTLLWVEIGIQSVHQSTGKFIRRGYDMKVFEEALERLKKADIKVVVHVIVGLPSETLEDTNNSIVRLCDMGIWGIKIHMLYICRGTTLSKFYEKEPFYLLTADEYVNFLKVVLTKIPPNIVIHRITGDCKKSELIAPWWILNKRYILNSINKI